MSCYLFWASEVMFGLSCSNSLPAALWDLWPWMHGVGLMYMLHAPKSRRRAAFQKHLGSMPFEAEDPSRPSAICESPGDCMLLFNP